LVKAVKIIFVVCRETKLIFIKHGLNVRKMIYELLDRKH